MIDSVIINEDEKSRPLSFEENHFYYLKSKIINPANLTKT